MKKILAVDYYPEHWEEDRWSRDFALMEEAGITAIRIAEFAWCRMEPLEGNYDFSWVEKVISLAANYNIKTILCTPTATPPAWLVEKHPHILPINQYKQVMNFGGRRHYCVNNEIYHGYSRRIVEEMAKRFCENPDVISFQIDNELYGVTGCHCETCRKRFQEWLQQKYGTLENLNKKWGTVFWSQEYSSWSQIPYPDGYVSQHPSLMLDYKRFHSECWVNYSNMQVEILRKYCGNKDLTTNGYLFRWGDDLDHTKLFEKLDVYSFDNYSNTIHEGAFYNDFARSIKERYWILEQKCGDPRGQYLYPDEDNRITRYTMQAYEHGCELVSYFRWRQGLFGHEQNHGAVLDHDGVPGDNYYEIKSIGNKLKDYSFKGVNERIGIYYSYEDSWVRSISKWNSYVDYVINQLYKGILDEGEKVKFIFEPEHIDNIDLLIIPMKIIHNEALAVKVRDYVAKGGKVIVTCDISRKNEQNVYLERKLPEVYSDLLGIDIDKIIPLRDSYEIAAGEKGELKGAWRCDRVKLNSAQMLIPFSSDPLEGCPALTENVYGKGKAYFAAALFKDESWSKIINMVMQIG